MTSSQSPSLVWFRQDLRLHDNPALLAAVERGGPVIPVYVFDDETPGRWAMGGASRWWLHESLKALDINLQDLGSRLVLRKGRADSVIPALADACNAGAVFWNRCYEAFAIERDTKIKSALTDAGIEAVSHNGSLLFEPWTVKNKSGEPFKVFSAFWRAATRDHQPAAPGSAPDALPAPKPWPESDALVDWALQPTKPDWAGGLRMAWTPGEQGARDRFETFLDETLPLYADSRDRPDRSVTSYLSPHLHFGEISPQTIWAAVESLKAETNKAAIEKSATKFLSEIGWREFSYHLLYHNPDLPDTSLREDFQKFPWENDKKALKAWQKGQTGYPIVDAGLRELWETGYMHNRVRMITASLLVKHLLIPWQEGEAWFWDTLVDADLANNSASWQWVAGCGADAAPYFRIFNPVLQGEKFDPDGAYVRRWVPELKDMPDKYIHHPWEAPDQVLREAKVRLGTDYPEPIVGLREGRNRALAAFETIKASAA